MFFNARVSRLQLKLYFNFGNFQITSAKLLFVFILIRAGVFSQITQQGGAMLNSTTSTTLSLDKPNGVLAGDVLIANIVQNETSNNNLSNAISSGWTIIDGRIIYDSGNGSNANQHFGTVLYKIATNSEPAGYSFSLTSSCDMALGSIIAFRGVNTTGGVKADGTAGGPFDVDPGILNVTGVNALTTANSITTISGYAGIVMLTQISSDRTVSNWTATDPSSLNYLYNYTTTDVDNGGVSAAWAVKTNPGSVGNCTAQLSFSDRAASIMIALKPNCNTTSVSSVLPNITCSNVSMTPVTHTTFGATGIGVASGLPQGINASFNSNNITITGSSSQIGTFDYSIPLNGGCEQKYATGRITIKPIPSVVAASTNSAICHGSSTNLTSTVNFNTPITIASNGFEPSDSWSFINNTLSGIAVGGTTVRTGANSLVFSGSNNFNVDPSISFDNVSLSGYSNVQLSISFASLNVDSGDDLFLDLSYDNGQTWTSTKLIDGSNNFTCSFNNAITTGGSGVVVGSNPYSVSIPSTVSQIKVRIRFNESSNNNSSDFYYIDDVSLDGTINTGTLSWTSNPSGFSSSLQNPIVTPDETTVYTLTATNEIGCSTSSNITVSLPTIGTELSANNDNASCVVNQAGWVHFYHSSGRLIGSINSQGQNLGNVTMTSYVDAQNALVPACSNPSDQSAMTAVLQRHWVVTPQFQPTSPVLVRWPQKQSELLSLSSVSTSNPNIYDDAQVPQDLKLSKYNGSNENASALDNCGTGTTTLFSQVNNGGPVSIYAPSIQGAAFYTDFQIPGFSEFWLHGSSEASPLPVELTSFNAVCEEGKGVNITWITASEHNSSHFNVLKSEDGDNWRSIATVAAAGNSTNTINYGIIDAEKVAGISYYKLMQYDIDGQLKEYGPISASCNSGNEMIIKTFPNPSGDEFYVELISPEATSTVITIIDAQGKAVYSRTVETMKGTNLYTFESLNVLPGMYYIQISNDLAMPNIVKHSFR